MDSNTASLLELLAIKDKALNDAAKALTEAEQRFIKRGCPTIAKRFAYAANNAHKSATAIAVLSMKGEHNGF